MMRDGRGRQYANRAACDAWQFACTRAWRLEGGVVLERSGIMWYAGPAFSVSARGDSSVPGASRRADLGVGRFAGPIQGRYVSTAVIGGSFHPPLSKTVSKLSSVSFSDLQNALRRFFLSRTGFSDSPLSPVSQPAAARVPRGPP
jgi:hypothetical protein